MSKDFSSRPHDFVARGRQGRRLSPLSSSRGDDRERRRTHLQRRRQADRVRDARRRDGSRPGVRQVTEARRELNGGCRGQRRNRRAIMRRLPVAFGSSELRFGRAAVVLPLIAHASALVVVERDGAGHLLRFAGDQVGPGRVRAALHVQVAQPDLPPRPMRWTSPRWPSPTSGTLDVARDPCSRRPSPSPPAPHEGARRPPSQPNPLCTPTSPAVDSVCLRVGYLAALLALSACSRSSGPAAGRRASGIQLLSEARAERSPVVSRDFPIEKRVRTCAGLCVEASERTVSGWQREPASRRAHDRSGSGLRTRHAAKAAMDKRGITSG